MARRRRARGSVGIVTKGAQIEVEGFEKLRRNIRRMSDQARVEILDGAVKEGAAEALTLMQQLAPRSQGAGTRGYHGADRLQSTKLWSRRNSRAAAVGIHDGADGAWFLSFQELGTIFHPAQPFMKPTATAMRKRMIDIVIKHWRRVVRKGTL